MANSSGMHGTRGMDLSSWKLPNIEAGNVWRNCESKKGLRYKIQAVTPEMYEEVHTLMENFFLREEAMSTSLALTDDPDSLDTWHKSWEKMLQNNLSIVAVTETEGKLIGANLLKVSSKSDPDIMDLVKGEKIRKFLYFTHHHLRGNVFEHYGVDFYLRGVGLTVLPEYRGHGIGEEFLRCRKLIAETLGIPVTATVFTSSKSQHLAEKAGFETLAEAAYDDYTFEGQKVFHGISSYSAKFMDMKY